MVACNGNEENSESKIASFKAEIVDSLVIDRLSVLELFDYEEAEVLSSFNPLVEGPSYMGNSYGWSFYGKDELAAYGHAYFYRYSKSGEILGRYEPPIEVGGGIILDFKPQRIKAFETERGTEVLAMILDLSNRNRKTQQFQDSIDDVFRMNFETGENTTVMHKQPDNIYRTAGEYMVGLSDFHTIVRKYFCFYPSKR